MGLFDSIKVEVKVPYYGENHKFQTKSLDNALEDYVITNKGELYREVWEYEWVENSLSVFGGYFKKIEGSYRREYLTDYHGDIIFYDDYNLGDFVARFSYGRLSRLLFNPRENVNDKVLQQRTTIWEQDSSKGNI